MKKVLIGCLFALITLPPACSQTLKAGFDKAEYVEMLKVSAAFGDSAYVVAFPRPTRYEFVYRSPVVGLDNRWDLWKSRDSSHPQAVISLRGTTANSASWLSNFYAAMVPASGTLTLSETDSFPYALSAHPAAAVHVGWLVSTAFLAKDILPKLDSCYRTGIKDMLLMGHSQGGAIAYLLTAHLYSLQKQGKLPADIRFKTYCSAGPKPGNLYFAYDYEAMTQEGWAYNVVNSADWVPEVPLSIQTLDDFNQTNPFVNAKGIIKKQKLPRRMAMKYVYNRLSKPSRRAMKNYQRYLGTLASGMVRKTITGYTPSAYYNSNNFVRTGSTIVLRADAEYYEKFPDNPEQIFVHHFHPPYLYLTQKLQLNAIDQPAVTVESLNGTWEVTGLAGNTVAFEELYPGQKPTLNFDAANLRVSGSTGCNNFNGPILVENSEIRFSDKMALTRRMCPGQGEALFLENLKKVDGYTIRNGQTLTLRSGTTVVMELKKK